MPVRVHALRSGGSGVNVWLVEGAEPVLVDAGMPGRGPALVGELDTLGVKPAWIVLTHSDPDHIGSANFIRERTGARVCAPAAERGLLEGTETPTPIVRRVVRWIMLSRQPIPVVDRWLMPGDNVGALTVVATPGHSPGHVSLVVDSTLMAGDAFDTTRGAVRERPGVLTSDRPAARRSIAALSELGLDAGYCGHGPMVENVSEKLSGLAVTWRQRQPAPPR